MTHFDVFHLSLYLSFVVTIYLYIWIVLVEEVSTIESRKIWVISVTHSNTDPICSNNYIIYLVTFHDIYICV